MIDAENSRQYDEIRKAKKEGLAAINKVVGRNINVEKGEVTYFTLAITEETATAIITGEFENFDDMRIYNDITTNTSDTNITILIRKVGGGKMNNDVYLIETFFISE